MDAIDLRTMSTIDRGDLGRRQRRSRSDFLILVRDALQYRPQGDDLVTEMLFWPHRDVAVAGTGALQRHRRQRNIDQHQPGVIGVNHGHGELVSIGTSSGDELKAVRDDCRLDNRFLLVLGADGAEIAVLVVLEVRGTEVRTGDALAVH